MSWDDEEGDIDYGDELFGDENGPDAGHMADRVPLFDEDEDDGLDEADNGPRHQTLLELTRGRNRDAAMYEIEDIVYKVAVLMNFIALRLVTSSGGRAPYMFDAETRQL